MAKLSIVMPVYNSEKFLHKSVGAILRQTFTDWELILVNDGSKDNSLAICQEYAGKDERIRVIDKKNEGAGPTRNAGIAVATGEYIVFPDSDDWLDEDAYRIALEHMEKNNVDLVIFGMKTHLYDDVTSTIERVVEDDITPIILKTQDKCREKWTELIKNVDLGSPCNKIYRMAIIKGYHLLFPTLRRMQDVVFNIDYYDRISSLEIIKDNLFNRTWHSSEFQRKKMPPTLLDCAITYHKTAIQALCRWGRKNETNTLIVHESFMSTLHTIAFDYLPYDDWSFKNVYRHIKVVTKHPYVRSFLKDYKRLKGKIRKKETAMLRGWNFVLALNSYKK